MKSAAATAILALLTAVGCVKGDRVVGDGRDASCPTTTSGFSERLQFKTEGDDSLRPLVTNPATPPSYARFVKVNSGPSGAPILCHGGCAALYVDFISGMSAGTGVAVLRPFDPPSNLVNARIAFSIAIDNPDVPIALRVFATDDASSFAAGPTVTVSGEGLAPYTAADTFRDATLLTADGDATTYCAAATQAVGLALVSTEDITPETAGTVILYINALTISSPP